jgi:hypothetical protein
MCSLVALSKINLSLLPQPNRNGFNPFVHARGIDHPTGELFETLMENTLAMIL